MIRNELLPIIIEREAERLRQEREVFDQHKEQEQRWFKLRLIMGYVSAVLLPFIALSCFWILLTSNRFPKQVVIAAGAALFSDVVGLIIGVWKIVLTPGSMTQLCPATTSAIPPDIIKELQADQQIPPI